MKPRLLLALSMALIPLCAAYGADSPTMTPTPLANNAAPAADSRTPAANPSAPELAGDFSAVDALITETGNSIKMLQDCMQRAATLKADLSKKQTNLKSEFGGKIPPAFNELLLIKGRRANKQQLLCAQSSSRPGQLYQQAHDSLRQFEPKSDPGIAARGKKLNAVKARYMQLFPNAKAPKE